MKIGYINFGVHTDILDIGFAKLFYKSSDVIQQGQTAINLQ